MTKSPLLQLKPFQLVLLIAGPGGSGKTSIAQKIGASEGWAHISEDDIWNEIGHPPDQLRHEHEQVIVHERVHDKLLQQLCNGKSVALEFILFHNPPQPLFDYQSFLAGHGIPFETRILRPSLEALVQRAMERGRETDLNQAESFRVNALHQLDCVSSVDPAWIVDSSGERFEASFERHFRRIAIKGQARKNIETIENCWDILYRDFPEVYDEFASVPGDGPGVNEFIFKKFDFKAKHVVDVGAGTGASTFMIAKHAGHVIGIEPEAAMREVACKQAKELGLKNVEFLAGTGEEIPLPDKSTDYVTAFTLAIYPPQRFKYFAKEAIRLTRSGGCIVSVGVTPYWYGGDLNEIVCGPGRVTKSDTENVVDRILVEEFGFDYEDVDSVQNYGSLDKIIRTYGFIFGSKAISYLREHNKTTIHWRNRVHFKYVQ